MIVNKETGEAVVELFDKRNVERINAEKYKAVPSGEYLASLNKRRTNPVPPSSRARSRGRYDSKQHRINSAAKLYEDFTGHEAKQALTIDIPELPDVMLCVGDIDFVGYTTVRDGKVEKYIHKFKKECRPLFAVSHDGKQLYMIGGSYDFTERGIVDRTK